MNLNNMDKMNKIVQKNEISSERVAFLKAY